MIPANVIEELKFRNRLEDVIGTYLSLSRAGSNMKGLCPFHSEKSPSFTVFPDGHYYCFGCGAGGDVITFVMRTENLDYMAALEYLAKRSGITLPEDNSNYQKGTSRQRVLEMNKCAARFFRDMLFDENIGREAREYFFSKRRLSGATVKRFGLGYAPNSFNMLRDHLKKNGYTYEEMVDAYLCQKSKKNENNVYDIFRNRVIFPIIDVSGNVIAFGGRVLDDSKPKYLNSGDTPAFRKSKNLFALNYARSECKEKLVLCEGYMDVIALHAAGFGCAVATLGTAITGEQARLMKRYTDKVVISYDSDSAGRTAATKAMKLLTDAGLEARVIKMEGAKDPDEYIIKFGREAYGRLISESRSEYDFKIDGLREKYDISIPDQKAKAANEIARDIALHTSRVERDIYIEKASRSLEISAESLKSDVERQIGRNRREQKKNTTKNLVTGISAIGDRVNPDKAKYLRICVLEEKLLGMMLSRSELMDKALKQVTEDDFYTVLNKKFFLFIAARYSEGGFDIGQLAQEFSADEISKIIEYKSGVAEFSLTDSAADEVIAALKKEIERQKSKDSGQDDINDILARRRCEK